MSLPEFWLEVGFGVSILINLILGVCVIGIFTKTREIKAKNPKLALYMAGMAIGFLGGILGNITITSMFELVKLVLPITPWYWGAIFLMSMAGTVVILLKMIAIFKEALGE